MTAEQKSFVYADETDLLNVVLFGLTAKEWREQNKGKKGNIRDYAGIKQLLVLSNMESYNAILIHQGQSQEQRMSLLRDFALQQLHTLEKLETTQLSLLTTGEGTK